jgi:hypothetical protein
VIVIGVEPDAFVERLGLVDVADRHGHHFQLGLHHVLLPCRWLMPIRRGECEVLDELVEAVGGGGSRALVVRGEPGMGKTALLE